MAGWGSSTSPVSIIRERNGEAVITPPDVPAGARRPGTSRRRRIVNVAGSLLLGVLVTILVAAAFIRVPYVIISPGDATALDAHVVTISGPPTYPHAQRLLFLTVQVTNQDPNLYRYVFSQLDSTVSVQKKQDVIGCASYAANARLNDLLMRDSQDTAKEVALTRLGYPVAHLGDQVVIADVACGGPSDHHLQLGDLITAVDGHAVTTATDVKPLVVAHHPGDVVHVTVRRGGETLTVAVRAGRSGNAAYLGILTQTLGSWRFPFTVTIDTQRVSGPSAGLAFTLAVIDDLTPGDLTGGHRVAVTGTIEPDGSIGPVGGVAQKAITAERNGATALIVPIDEAQDARSHAGHLRIFTVRTINDALSALHQLGGASLPPPPPSTTTTAP
jgi:Lon-like protease